jgi:hypothetical protein
MSIDTIRLRLHACNHQKKSIIEKTISENTNQSLMLSTANNALYLKLLSIQGKGFDSQKIYSSEKYVFSDEPFENIVSKNTSKGINAHYLAMNKIRFISEDKIKETNLSIKGRYKLDSSQTTVSYMINPNKGFVDFEFSIPKYLYGHNLAQFVPQYNSSTYIENVQFMKKREVQLSLLYNRLYKFIKLFFTDLCINLKLEEYVDFHYIEVRRIDLCYNQYFETKEDALMYLDHQKKFALKSTLYNP